MRAVVDEPVFGVEVHGNSLHTFLAHANGASGVAELHRIDKLAGVSILAIHYLWHYGFV